MLEDVPRYEILEKLPYLVRTHIYVEVRSPSPGEWKSKKGTDGTSTQTAVIKEGLRMFPSAIAHPRVVPPEGAVISGSFIPGGVSRKHFSFHAAAAAATITPLPKRHLAAGLVLPFF